MILVESPIDGWLQVMGGTAPLDEVYRKELGHVENCCLIYGLNKLSFKNFLSQVPNFSILRALMRKLSQKIFFLLKPSK